MLPSRCDARYTPSRFYFIFITYNSGKDGTIGFEGERICMIQYPRAHNNKQAPSLGNEEKILIIGASRAESCMEDLCDLNVFKCFLSRTRRVCSNGNLFQTGITSVGVVFVRTTPYRVQNGRYMATKKARKGISSGPPLAPCVPA